MRAVVAGCGSIGRALAVVGALGVVASPTLSAQSLLSSSAAGIRISSDDSTAQRQPKQMPRLYPAAAFGLAGAVTFGFIGYMIGGQCKRACNVLSKNHVLVGAGIGEILGSAYGAARPRGRGHCTRTERIGMGVGGAAIGALASTATAQVPPGRISMLAVIPLGSVIFMGGC